MVARIDPELSIFSIISLLLSPLACLKVESFTRKRWLGDTINDNLALLLHVVAHVLHFVFHALPTFASALSTRSQEL